MDKLEKVLLETKARLEKTIAIHKHWIFGNFSQPLFDWMETMKKKVIAGTYKLNIAEYDEDYSKMLKLEGQFKTHKKRTFNERYKNELVNAERELNEVNEQLYYIGRQKEKEAGK